MNNKISFFDLSIIQRDAMVHFGWVAKNGMPLKKGIKVEYELTVTEIKVTLLIKHELIEELNKLIAQDSFMV